MKNLNLSLPNTADYSPLETHVRNAARLSGEAIARLSATIRKGAQHLYAMAVAPLDSRVAVARNEKEVSPVVSAAAAQL